MSIRGLWKPVGYVQRICKRPGVCRSAEAASATRRCGGAADGQRASNRLP
jgi:hypothetical protein